MDYVFNSSEDGSRLDIKINEAKFDAAGIDAFKEQLEAVWSSKVTVVRIDFSAVQFIDSSGVGALLSVQKKMPPKCEPVTIAHARPNVVSVIELLRLHRVFKMEA
jgi:anti-sigma B factor antagonist